MLPVEIISGYFPFLLRENFGNDTYLPYFTFSTLSLFGFWLFVFVKSRAKKVVNCVRNGIASNSRLTGKMKFVYVVIVSMLTIQAIIIAMSFNDISYQHLASVDYKRTRPLLIWGTTMFMFSKHISLLLLFKLITARGGERIFSMSLFLWAIFQNLLYGVLAGSRSGLLAIIVAIVFAVYGYRKVSLKNFIKFGIIVLLVLISLQQVRNLRKGSVESDEQEYAILQNDYAAPGQLTIAAIKYDAIMPLEVMKSNICRSFPNVSYPYLYVTMTEIFLPGLVNEANSMGFYIFTEGYMFCGMLGFIYNAIVIGILVMYWRRMGRTNNNLFNIFILSLMISCFFGMVRAQSVWFIRYLWLSIIPMVILYSWFMNVKINYKNLLFH